MGKWFGQAAEIEKLRAQVRQQEFTIAELRKRIADLEVASLYPETSAEPAPRPVSSYFLTAEERELIAKGQKLAAIQAIRARTDLPLKNAKDLVDGAAAA